MKRIVTLLAGLTVLASASLASAHPVTLGLRQRARVGAAALARDTQEVMRSARLESGRGFHRQFSSPAALRAVQELDRAADQLVVALSSDSGFRMRRAFRAVEERYAQARTALPFARHSAYAQAKFQSCVNCLKPTAWRVI